MRSLQLPVTVALIAVVVVAAFVVGQLMRPTPAPDTVADPVVRPGDRVLATGFIRVDASGAEICRPGPQTVSPGPASGVVCGPMAVALSGYLPKEGPANAVTVQGIWDGTAIAVDYVDEPALQDPFDRQIELRCAFLQDPCPTPAFYDGLQLQEAADSFTSLLGQFGDAQIEEDANRVRVRCVQITDRLAAQFNAFPQAIPDPLMVKA